MLQAYRRRRPRRAVAAAQRCRAAQTVRRATTGDLLEARVRRAQGAIACPQRPHDQPDLEAVRSWCRTTPRWPGARPTTRRRRGRAGTAFEREREVVEGSRPVQPATKRSRDLAVVGNLFPTACDGHPDLKPVPTAACRRLGWTSPLQLAGRRPYFYGATSSTAPRCRGAQEVGATAFSTSSSTTGLQAPRVRRRAGRRRGGGRALRRRAAVVRLPRNASPPGHAGRRRLHSYRGGRPTRRSRADRLGPQGRGGGDRVRPLGPARRCSRAGGHRAVEHPQTLPVRPGYHRATWAPPVAPPPRSPGSARPPGSGRCSTSGSTPTTSPPTAPSLAALRTSSTPPTSSGPGKLDVLTMTELAKPPVARPATLAPSLVRTCPQRSQHAATFGAGSTAWVSGRACGGPARDRATRRGRRGG